MIELRALRRDDVPILARLQRETAGSMAPIPEPALAALFYDEARGHGSHGIVAVDGATVRGATAWIAVAGEGYLAPLIAGDDDIAAALIDAGTAQVRTHGARWIRLSTSTDGCARSRAAEARGFGPVFDFIDLARPTAPVDVPDVAPLVFTPLPAVDRDALLALYNGTFEEVPSSPPMTRTSIDELLAAPALFAAASAAIVAPSGELVAFLVGLTFHDASGTTAIVDAVGVRAERRGQRLGRALVARLLAAAADAGIRQAIATIASTNTSSLRLHQALGFAPRWARRVWQRDL